MTNVPVAETKLQVNNMTLKDQSWANKAAVMFTRATPRWVHQAIFSRIMGAANRGDRDAYRASVKVAR